ncbi:MAG: ThiF family adenylyltransferase [Candidatus Obscuribacterales bacterium]|jgi:molybdopterin/thiamine biosynthesis adenylyltransferase
MSHRFHHEQIFRGQDAMRKIAGASVLICGAGALGSNLAETLARMGVTNMTVIDKDRVEEHNVGTQVYSLDDVGGQKAELLRNLLYREVGVEITARAQELTEKNVSKLLKGATLVVDVFDNTASRRLVTDYCRDNGIACLHAGMNDAYGEVIWNEKYRVPSDAGIDVCDYPLARNLVTLVVSVAAEVLVRYVLTGQKRNYSVTVGDLSINEEFDL